MFDFPRIEEKILKFWQDNNIFDKLRKKNQGKEPWSFLDGPITANNPMGVHHAWGRTYKDLFQRHKAMKGHDLRYQNGFDCQGLWVEVEVEKELGFDNKKDIEDYGIDKFVEKCKERVKKYSHIQTEQSERLGQWMDWENSYFTMSEENNYAIWNFLKKCLELGFLYKGRDVVPWCPRCGTAISQHEILTEEYKEITHKAVFLKIPLLKKKNKYFLVWTTTPWTLPANVALAVNPDLDYAEVEKEGEVFIVLKSKKDLLVEGEVKRTFSGKELERVEYQGIFDELEEVGQKVKEHKVLLWKDVSEEEGTGIVHIAPGCGKEDFQLSKNKNLPVIDPTDQESRYREGFGFLTGKMATEVRDLIFDNLKQKDLIFKIEEYTHRYPTCWRCKEELIFRLVEEWYISMDKLRKPLMESAKKIDWIPSFGLDRELDWLKNMEDWLISKKRYWGLALPIFECSECGNIEVIGSREELKERAVSGWEEFEGHTPHRPWVDKIQIKCSKCGEKVSRILDVGNPWLDAGIVPFSTMGYYQDKDYWKKWFPADLICESFPGQFKNWFYAIIVMSQVLENTNPVKTIYGYASVKDEKGEEMHKSKGNAIWFDEAVSEIGAGPMRWLYARQNPTYNLRFGYEAASEAKRRLLTLYNVFSFFETYVNKEEVKEKESNNILDKWIVSRLENLVEKVEKGMEQYDVCSASRDLEKFFIDDLSLWYLRRSRSRFHEKGEQREQAIATIHYVLSKLLCLMAPITPFFAEELYLRIKRTDDPESVHLKEWPVSNKTKRDKKLEDKMKIIRDIAGKVLSQRAEKEIRVRQPLSSLKVKSKRIEDSELIELLKEEVNVKKILFDDKIKEEVVLDTEITSALAEEGRIRELIRNIRSLRKKLGLTPEKKVNLIISNFPLEFDKSFLAEAGAENYKQTSDSSEIEKTDAVKEIEIEGKKYLIGIKK